MVHAICEMMKEFSVIVAGCGVAISTAQPEKKRLEHYKSIFVLQNIDDMESKIEVSLSKNFKNN